MTSKVKAFNTRRLHRNSSWNFLLIGKSLRFLTLHRITFQTLRGFVIEGSNGTMSECVSDCTHLHTLSGTSKIRESLLLVTLASFRFIC